VADRVTAVLEEVLDEGTGVRARIGRPAAGKTGTGQEYRDAWFVGYTPELATAVWMGFPEEGTRSMVPPATPLRVTGGTWPATAWQRFMAAALASRPATPFAEVLRRIRARAYQSPIEDSWAAYCFYGDPAARVDKAAGSGAKNGADT
jgi:penicillin-binding protein 1A